MLQSAPPSDCTRCGVCCFSELDDYIRVSGDDHARLGEASEAYVHFTHSPIAGTRAFMNMMKRPEGRSHCSALRETSDGQFLCQVYEHRPTICRELERGSPECAGEIATKESRVRLHVFR